MRMSVLRRAGLWFSAGGLAAAAWGGILLAHWLARSSGAGQPATVADLASLARSLGLGWEMLWLLANVCWLIGLTMVAGEHPWRVRAVFLVLPTAAVACYLAGWLLGHGLLPARWPLPVPATAIGAGLWSVGMIALGVSAVRSRAWSGHTRWLPLAVGLFYPLVPLPLMFALGHPPVYLLGLGWGMLWTAVGVGLWQEESAVPDGGRGSRTGDVLINPVTGETVVVRVGTAETMGEYLEADLYLRAGAAVAGEHYHPTIDERFTVVRGTVGFRLNGVEQVAGPGVTVEVPAGAVHDWWNAGPDEAHVRVALGPNARRFEAMIRTIFGLARDGRVDAKGMPGPLQLAVFAREFDDVIRFTKPPRWVQRALFGLLAPVARLLGYRGLYPEYLTRSPFLTAATGSKPREVARAV